MNSHIFSLRNFFLLGAFLLPLIGGVGCSAKAKIERHVQRADDFYDEGKRDEARIEYLNAFRLNRNNPHVAARLGETFLEQGEIAQAFQFFSHARNLQPTNNDVRVKVASLLLLGGKVQESRAEIEEVLKTAPTHPDALLLLVNSVTTTNDLAAVRSRLQTLAATNVQDSAIFLGLGVLAQRSRDTNSAETLLKRAVELEPRSSKNNLTLGNFYFAIGNTNNAERYLKAAMEIAELKSIERLAFAEFLTKTGRAAEAKKILEESVQKEPDFLAGWNTLTQIAFSENNQTEAAEYIANALAQDPQNRDSLLNRARLKIAQKDFKGAADELEKLAVRNPRDSQVQYHLATAKLANDKPNEALASLDQAVAANTNNIEAILLRSRVQISKGQVDNAISDLNRMIRQYPQVPQSYYLLASAYQVRGAVNDAIAVYTAIAKAFPNDPQAHHLLGGIYVQQRKLPEARQSYEAALKINPDYLAAIDDLIDLDVIRKDYDAALARAQVYLEKYPDKPMPSMLQAKVLFAQSKNDEAERAVKKAIELDPEFTPAHRMLADFYVRTQQTDQALEKLQAIVQKNPKDIGALVQMGMLYEAKSDFPRAQQAYEAVLAINPNNVAALNNLAYIVSEQKGELDRAYQYARKAREVSPYDGYTADTLGWITWKRGDYSQALAILQQSAERLPNHPEVQYHLGMAYYMTGSPAPATAALTKALQSTNSFIGREKAQYALTILNIEPSKPTPESFAVLQKAIAGNPSDVFAYTQLAQLHEAQSAWDKARDTYEKALEKNPRSTTLLSRLAALHVGPLKQPVRALELAKQAWSIDRSGDLAAALGPIGYSAGDFKWAYGVLLDAQRAQPENSQVSYFSGLAAYAVGRIPQAEEALTRAAQANSLPPQTKNLAKAGAMIANFHLGRIPVAEAQSAVTSALEVDAQFPPAKVASGLIAERNGDFPSARAQYEAVIKGNPGLLIAQRQLALLLSDKLPDDSKAFQLATALRADFPDDPQLSKALGKIAYRRNDYNEAARLLRLASSSLSNDGDLLYHLGMAQYHLKDKSAKATLAQAVQLEPNSGFTPEAKKIIAQLK